MAKIQISPEQLAKVKQTLNVSAPTGKPTMGAAGKAAQHKPGMPGSGKSAKLPQVAIKGKVEPQPKSGTFELPSVVQINGKNYSMDDIFRAHRNAVQTYGQNSDEARALRAAGGLRITPEGQTVVGIKRFAKPDMRGDAKSYVDTLQHVGGSDYDATRANLVREYKNDDSSWTADAPKIMHKFAEDILVTLGIKPGSRNLSEDKNARQK